MSQNDTRQIQDKSHLACPLSDPTFYNKFTHVILKKTSIACFKKFPVRKLIMMGVSSLCMNSTSILRVIQFIDRPFSSDQNSGLKSQFLCDEIIFVCSDITFIVYNLLS